LTSALRPYTFDLHVAQNDGTGFCSGSHDKTARHCRAPAPHRKFHVAPDSSYWLRDEKGELSKAFKRICQDCGMIPNRVMNNQQAWNDILAALIKVRNAHGWAERG